jgi:tripartite ATP-independent transporter DctM subunit
MELTIFVVLFLFLIIIGCPLAFAMILSSLVFISMSGFVQYMIIPQTMTGGLDSFSLLAIPLFLLAGNLMNELGVTERIFNFAVAIVGHIAGGLAHVNVIGSMIFAGMSGSAIADAAGLGAIQIKAMNERGYRTAFSAAVTAAASIIGPIIPPSIPFVIFATLSNVSVEKLFMAGFIPGVILGLTLMIQIYIMAKTGKEYCPVTPRSSFIMMLKAFKPACLSLLAPIILICGISFGVFTATEAGGVAVVYTFFLGAIYRKITRAKLQKALTATFLATATVLFLIAAGTAFAWLIALLKVPEAISDFFFSITTNKYLIFLFINIFLLIQGCFMSATAGLIIVTPMILGIANKLGLDPVHLGVIIVLNIQIGILTPPVGMVLFVVKEIAKIPFEDLCKAMLPFYIPLMVTLLLVTYWPQMVLFIPNLMK